MPKAPFIGFRASPAFVRALDGVAEHAGVSKSAVIRMFVAEGLERHLGPAPEPTDPPKQPTMSIT